MIPVIKKLPIPGLMINARVWGSEDGLKILALHGWLDNAASFDLLAPFLPEYRIISIDFPGHGFSDKLPLCANYSHSERMLQMIQVADTLGWDKFSILGHSMGGIIGTMIAATIPERVEKLLVIDAIPFPNMKNITVLWKKYYAQMDEIRKPHRLYRSYQEAAIKRSVEGHQFPMKQSSAEVLARGGMEAVEGGYVWTFDLRLLLPSIIPIEEKWVIEILRAISADTCFIVPEDGLLKNRPGHMEIISLIKKINIVTMPGHHHLHMDDAQSVAQKVKDFFGSHY